ncbi:MAG TPA: hypothetical protein DCQ93_01600 [Bacteroidetes bacterium]|nr:hypothetical protein [Bacteroidota bacterium]
MPLKKKTSYGKPENTDDIFIEIKNKGARGRGVKMRVANKADLPRMIKMYEDLGKEVIIHGKV